MDWMWSLDVIKNCDPELVGLVKRHVKHFEEMGEMTPRVFFYDDKENPNKLLKQLREKYEFFRESKWDLEKYRNRKFGRFNPIEIQFIEYLEYFYLDLYPAYELNLIGTIDTLSKKIYREGINGNYP